MLQTGDQTSKCSEKQYKYEEKICGWQPTVTYGPVVKRLRRRPLTAKTRVRFPAGSPLGKALICVNMDLQVKLPPARLVVRDLDSHNVGGSYSMNRLRYVALVENAI